MLEHFPDSYPDEILYSVWWTVSQVYSTGQSKVFSRSGFGKYQIMKMKERELGGLAQMKYINEFDRVPE